MSLLQLIVGNLISNIWWSLHKVPFGPLVDWINSGFGQPSALTDSLWTRSQSLKVHKCGEVRTFGFSLWAWYPVLIIHPGSDTSAQCGCDCLFRGLGCFWKIRQALREAYWGLNSSCKALHSPSNLGPLQPLGYRQGWAKNLTKPHVI